MPSASKAFSVLWWTTYTVLGVWAHRTVPGIDFFAPGIILSLQNQGGRPTILLALVWILLIEGMGSLPFGYGLAWYGSLSAMYFVGRRLFEARSILFMGLIGLGLGVAHPVLTWGLSSLANLRVSLEPLVMQGCMQAVSFPLIWLLAGNLFPTRLKQDVRPL